MTAIRLIAALGSSFAAGPGIDPIVDIGAQRSSRNYAHQLAERLGARLVDRTVSGATTANIVDTPQATPDGREFAPQLEGVPADADVVTVTAGGNDLQFAGALLHTAWTRHDPTSPLLDLMGAQFPHGIPAPTDTTIAAATAGLVRIVEESRRRASNARIVLVDYLSVLGDDTARSGSTPFTDSEIAELLPIQEAIAQAFADAAAATGADLLRASALSARHALGSSEPWVQPFHTDLLATGGSFHPDLAGMTAIAAALEELLGAG